MPPPPFPKPRSRADLARTPESEMPLPGIITARTRKQTHRRTAQDAAFNSKASARSSSPSGAHEPGLRSCSSRQNRLWAPISTPIASSTTSTSPPHYVWRSAHDASHRSGIQNGPRRRLQFSCFQRRSFAAFQHSSKTKANRRFDEFPSGSRPNDAFFLVAFRRIGVRRRRILPFSASVG